MRKGSGALDFPGGHLVFNTNLNDFIVFSNCIYIAFFSATVDSRFNSTVDFLKPLISSRGCLVSNSNLLVRYVSSLQKELLGMFFS